MLTVPRYVFVFFMTVFFALNLHAQQNPSQLPSLINNQTQNDSETVDQNIEAALQKKMFVKVFTNKNKIFVGEPVMATYKFYVASAVNDQPSVTKQPEFTGFSVKELNFSQTPEIEFIDNEEYSTYTIRKVQLTPLEQGTLSLGNAFVNNIVEIADPSNPYTTRRYSIVVDNADASLEVNDLPEKNKPGNFYGITGNFKISAIVTNNKIPVNENGHLIIRISGSGNLEAINKPEISWPANIQHFDGSDSQHIDQDNFPVTGYKTFDIPFIGNKEGMSAILPIQFSFFNTSSGKYETISTDSIHVTFTTALSKKEEFINVINYDTTNRKYLWIVPAIAVVVGFIGFISYKRNRKNTRHDAAVMSATPPPTFAEIQPVYHVRYRTDFSKHLGQLSEVTDNRQFFTMAKDLITKAVAERLDSQQYSEQLLLSELKERTYNAPVCSKVSALYEVFDLNLYAPFDVQHDLVFYFNEVKVTVEELQAES